MLDSTGLKVAPPSQQKQGRKLPRELTEPARHERSEKLLFLPHFVFRRRHPAIRLERIVHRGYAHPRKTLLRLRKEYE